MMRSRWPCCVLLMVLILVSGGRRPPTAAAQAPIREDPQRVIGFAHHLLSQGDAYRAISEYKAFLFSFPHHPRATEAWYFMGKAYREEGQWNEALRAFSQAARGRDAGSGWTREAALEMGETLLTAGRPAAAARAFEGVAGSSRWRTIRNRGLYRAAWSWMQARRWNQALRVLREIELEDPLRAAADGLRREVEEGLPGLPRRSPWIAGGLAALLPGSGHLYAGRPRAAAASFVLNGIFVAAAVLAFQEGYFITGGMLSFIEMSWYFGGITTAAGAARQFNRESEADWLRGIGNRWGLRLQVDPRTQSSLIQWALPF